MSYHCVSSETEQLIIILLNLYEHCANDWIFFAMIEAVIFTNCIWKIRIWEDIV